MEELTSIKDRADNHIVTKQYDEYISLIINFEGVSPMLTNGFINTDKTLTGKKLFDIYDLSVDAQGTSVCLMNHGDNKGSFIFTASLDDIHSIEFLNDLENHNNQHLISTLIQLIFIEIENTYFSSDWWNNLDIIAKEMIKLQAKSFGSDNYNLIDATINFNLDNIKLTNIEWV